ncbi:MAG: hypothetical protein F4Y82_03960 [Cenarchaeum sp. SB0665_bin_23]|nr:hypothetical protein [Cenarchaeum sp. SB0667_bin_13]MXY61255.1 hypothetical protein [Cenarchaeum sp. SB0665_bin_23]MXZ93404.1 hypothetical protein [Cenarchaeum sp. SB0666_bin_15]MYB47468.1 hypothetical protein [Cenarchaeum sp. SB0662_bin_33]MYC80075.1 hypothetical protein [Cenarchaeum sp. SB0661_bin_35]MYD58321.1 hypothetical protein [Cenarchaeum sp. SB0678_bin_8]MYG32632.1 hypothetical protein [Cenarchaeum sp. SB0677_bin_16]MYI52207.1 hypothetical protein [Cenarchaeum sp. SB0673_bin_9]M
MSAKDKILQNRTLSYQKIILNVRGVSIPLRLKRHLAPRTVRRILASLPLRGHAHSKGSMIYINTEVKSGLERGRDDLLAGDVAFLPGQQCLCFITNDYNTQKLMTPLGVMEGDISILKELQPGDVLSIYEDAG